MRPIKFRQWLGNRWHFFGVNIIPKFKGFTGVINAAFDVHPIMQFTGLTDKNGKEIYEGDIVKTNDDWELYGMQAGEINEVYFYAGGFRLKPKYNPNAKGHWLEDGKDVEIIGNIHENPELLKEG